MVCASEVDIEEAYRAGRAAVEQALQGKSGHMIALERSPGDRYRCATGLVRLEDVANLKRSLPDEFISGDGNDVTEAFLAWARPLIAPGLPEYARLRRVPVTKKLPRS